MALRYAKNHADAEEITQEVFIKCIQALQDFRSESSLKTWIYRITINQSINYIKKRDRFKWVSFSLSSAENATAEDSNETAQDSRIEQLLEVIDTLAINQKTAFLLAYMEELPRQEIAEIMGISLKAVESLLSRAKDQLRKKIKFLE